MSTSETTEDSPVTPPWGNVSRQPIFATTRWSVVLAAGRGDVPQARDALETLCRTYWYPLYVYVRRRGYLRHALDGRPFLPVGSKMA